MNTTAILIIVLLGAAVAALAAAAVVLRRETARLRSEKESAEASQTDLGQRLAATETLLTETRQARDGAQSELRALREEHLRTQTDLAALRASSAAEIDALRTKNAEERDAERTAREKLEERFRLEFKNLATEILGEQSREFKQTNKESLDLLLKPFRENITEFRERVERIYSHENEQRGELKNELKRLMELNQHISADARNLTDDQFRKFLKQNLDNYKRPRDFEFVESLPKNSLNKVLKRKLREDAVEKMKQRTDAEHAEAQA